MLLAKRVSARRGRGYRAASAGAARGVPRPGRARASGAGAPAVEARSCPFCFHRVHRIPQRHLPSGASDFQGDRGGGCPRKADGCDGKHSSPFLLLSLPATLFCLSHMGSFKAICPHVEQHQGFSPALRADFPWRGTNKHTGSPGHDGAAEREQPAETPLTPGSRFSSQPGLSPNCTAAARPSPARLPQEGDGAVSDRAGLFGAGLNSLLAGLPHAHPRPLSCRSGACESKRPSSSGLGKGWGCWGWGVGVDDIPGASLR